MTNLVPINSIDLKGETIRQEIFINIGGGEKTILVFESGRVLLMPVYKKCPVQIGTVEDIKDDLPEYLKSIEAVRQQAIEEADTTIKLLKEL